MTVTVLVDNAAVALLAGSAPRISLTLDQRSTASFTVLDDWSAPSATPSHIAYGSAVSITDDVAGLLFSGYVNDTTESNLPGTKVNTITVNCIDQHYLADKRVSLTDYTNMDAGDIAVDLCANYLADEGVTASYAMRRDSTQADFEAGTLTNVVATDNVEDGDLELAPAGVLFSQMESSTSDFAAGSLNRVVAINNRLQLASTQAIKLVGTAAVNVSTNPYTYVKIWSGSHTISTGDYITYDVWISSTSPAIIGGPDFVCSDGSTLRDSGSLDQFHVPAHPNADLSGFAADQWYSRSITIAASLSGKSISYASIASEGDKSGTYTIYVRHFKLFNASHVLQVTFFDTSLMTNQQLQSIGYYNVTTSQVTVYEQSGTRVSPAYDISGAGKVRNSLIAWTANLPTITSSSGSSSTAGAVLIETTWDGDHTWQVCTSHQAIPGLMPGMNLGGKAINIRQTLSLIGPSPEYTPSIQNVALAVQPSYACIKSDAADMAALSSGSLTNVTSTGAGNQLTGAFKNWDDGDVFTGTTLYGASSPFLGAYYHWLTIASNAGTDAKVRFDFAGQWTNFVAEIDVLIPLGNTGADYGFVYRTTGWVNGNDTYAYNALITPTAIALYKATNGGASSRTLIATFAVTLTANNFYRLKVVVSGSTHTLYLNDALYISVTDATYTGAGYIGVRIGNGGSGKQYGYFDNLGIMPSAFTGSRVHNAVSLDACHAVTNSVIQWNAAVPSGTTLLIEAKIDSGSYAACTNGGVIPGVTPGTDMTGRSLTLRETYTTTSATITPTLTGITAYAVGYYSASGSRVAPTLNLSAAGRAGSTLVSWNGLVPAGTSMDVDTSLDGGLTWLSVGSGMSGAVPIGGIREQPDPIDDSFASNTSGFYTSTSQTGGSEATWTYDTANSRLLASGGATAFYLYNGLLADDVEMITDMDTSDAAGLVWRLTDTSNFYDLVVADDTSPSPNSVYLYRVVDNGRITLATASIPTWPRGMPRRIRMLMLGPVITLFFDGVQILSYTDNFPLGEGQCGLRTNTYAGASNATFYKLRIAPQGESVIGKIVETRTTLVSTDPTVTPQLLSLQTSARNANIASGAFIPTTTYNVLGGSTNTIASDFDDLAKQSNYWWRINENKAFFFQPHNGTPAPFLLTGSDMLIGYGPVSLVDSGSFYRNGSWILGGTDTLLLTSPPFATDGISQAFTMDYPVDSLVGVSDGVHAYTFGVRGIDTGRDFYYQQGNNTINQDVSEAPLAGVSLTFAYYGQINAVSNAQNEDLVQQQAALGCTSGIVEVAETAQGLNRDAATQLALSRLAMYGMDSRVLTFPTARVGLAVGQLLSVFLTPHGLVDEEFLITSINIQYRVDTFRGTLDTTPYFTVTATDGAVLNQWYTTLAQLGR